MHARFTVNVENFGAFYERRVTNSKTAAFYDDEFKDCGLHDVVDEPWLVNALLC